VTSKTVVTKAAVTKAAVATKVTANEADSEPDLSMTGADAAAADVAKFAAPAATADAGVAKPVVHDATADKLAAPVAEKALASDEDNPLYMPSTPSAAFEQVLEMNVAHDVEVRLTLDGKRVEKSWFEANTYRYTFNNKAEVYILDASQVDLLYNGKSLGVLGSKGRKRRILLQAKASQDDFPQ
jgi:hypothetical protein